MFAFFFKRNHTFDTEKRGCVKTLTQPFSAQSPDFIKPWLCYYPKFL